MSIKDFEITKLLMGCFYEEDFSYEQKKGDFFNKAKKILNGKNVVHLNTPPIGDFLFHQENKFQLKVSDKSMHFEGALSKDTFIDYSNQLFDLHDSSFKDNELLKIGFVVFFKLRNKTNFDLFSKYFRNIDLGNIRNSSFNVNYVEPMQYNYNSNLTIQSDENRGVTGEIDFNLSKSDSVILSKSHVSIIFNDLYSYYIEKLMNKINM